jgi:hypothetical protein
MRKFKGGRRRRRRWRGRGRGGRLFLLSLNLGFRIVTTYLKQGCIGVELFKASRYGKAFCVHRLLRSCSATYHDIFQDHVFLFSMVSCPAGIGYCNNLVIQNKAVSVGHRSTPLRSKSYLIQMAMAQRETLLPAGFSFGYKEATLRGFMNGNLWY